MRTERYDLVVIGGGPAGIEGACTAAHFGRRVALVERCRDLGGACANTGTLPSKTLRETALALTGLRARNLYGVDLSLRRAVTVRDLMYHEARVVAGERDEMGTRLEREGVERYCGVARFVDPHTIRVTAGEGGEPGATDEVLLETENVLIAIGSRPLQPPEFPFAHDRVFDSDEILALHRLPRSLAVVGAGVIGSEYACTFAALGARVDVIDGRDELLSFLDAEISEALESAMRARLGVRFRWREHVLSCRAPEAPDAPIELGLASGERLEVDAVLVAAGRWSPTDALDLGAAGIAAGKNGLLSVDACFRTSVPHVYAVGDVIGFPALAATSMEQARVAMARAFDIRLKEDLAPILPFGVYTIPEAGVAGKSEEDLRKEGVDCVVGRASYGRNARGRILGDSTGMLKLVFRRGDMKLLGVHVLGDQATELVHVGLAALLVGADASLFNRMCFNYPTLGDLYKDATYDALAKTVAPAQPRS
jgi:NAD(P) transhydrogenase